MKELRLIMSDDLIRAQTGERVEADGTHTLSLDGRAVELDLTDLNYKELMRDVQRWLDAGQKPGQEPLLPGAYARPARSGHQFTPGIVGHNRGLRAWVDAQELKSPKHPELPAYETPTGRWYYPGWLKKAYAAHLAEQEAGE
jgi:hypothetical protein